MTISGVHTILYSSEPDELRRVIADVFGWSHVDAGDGWLIFATPPSELAVHPSDSPAHQVTFFCDDLATTVSELEAKGVEFVGEPSDQGWGISTTMVLPGGVEVMLYEPWHEIAAGS